MGYYIDTKGNRYTLNTSHYLEDKSVMIFVRLSWFNRDWGDRKPSEAAPYSHNRLIKVFSKCIRMPLKYAGEDSIIGICYYKGEGE